MQCPTCGNELALLAEACPNCGQPGLGSILRQVRPIFTPEEEAKQLEAMGTFFAVLLKIFFVVGAGGAVVWAVYVWFTWATESPFVVATAKWLAIIAGLFSICGVISGFITQSTQGSFAYGYKLGQFAGPVGLIIVIFQIPEKSQAEDSIPQPESGRATLPRRNPAKKTLIRFVCPDCQKRYKVDESALGKGFQCPNCGETNIITALTNIVVSPDEFKLR